MCVDFTYSEKRTALIDQIIINFAALLLACVLLRLPHWPLCPPQIPHWLVFDLTRTLAIRVRLLASWAMAQLPSLWLVFLGAFAKQLRLATGSPVCPSVWLPAWNIVNPTGRLVVKSDTLCENLYVYDSTSVSPWVVHVTETECVVGEIRDGLQI